MKKGISLIIVVFAAFLLVSCGNKDEVADEIVHYYNEQWVPINAKDEEEMLDLFDKLYELEKKDKENKATAYIKNEMLPVVDEILERLESVDSSNKEVKKMNDMQIEAEQHERNGLKAIKDYYEGSKSEDELNSLKEEWEQKIDDVIEYRDELMEKYDLELDRNEEKIGDFYKLKRAAD